MTIPGLFIGCKNIPGFCVKKKILLHTQLLSKLMQCLVMEVQENESKLAKFAFKGPFLDIYPPRMIKNEVA